MDASPVTNHPVVIFIQHRKDGSEKHLSSVECLQCTWKVKNIDNDVPFSEWLAAQHGHEVLFHGNTGGC